MENSRVLYVLEDGVEEFEAENNLLRSALEEGVGQEYSCRVGMCMACVGRIVDASVDEVINYLDNGGNPGDVGEKFGYFEGSFEEISGTPHVARTLGDEDLEDGYVFTCVASPAGAEELVLDLTSTLNKYPESI